MVLLSLSKDHLHFSIPRSSVDWLPSNSTDVVGKLMILSAGGTACGELFGPVEARIIT